MNTKKMKIVVLFLLSFVLLTAQAQEAVTAAGGDASGSGGTVAYSVGQTVYTTNTGTNASVAQGVQQAFVILVLTGLEEVKGINLTVSAYPNPTTDFLNLKVENYDNRNMSYQLFDMFGKLLETKKLVSDQTRIGMSNLATATYFVKVIQNKKEVKTFKIIKY
jgi:opacity protein-like surface antigen